jgi:hypothetical protein
LDRYLRFSIRPQVGQDPFPTHLTQPPNQLAGKDDGQGHQLRGLVTSEAEHHALVAGTAAVDALRDIGITAATQHEINELAMDITRLNEFVRLQGEDATGERLNNVNERDFVRQFDQRKSQGVGSIEHGLWKLGEVRARIDGESRQTFGVQPWNELVNFGDIIS